MNAHCASRPRAVRGAADLDLAPRGLLQPGDQLEQGRLAAARRPDQAEHAVRRQLEVEPLDRRQLAVEVAQVADRDGGADPPRPRQAMRSRRRILLFPRASWYPGALALLTKKVRKVE